MKKHGCETFIPVDTGRPGKQVVADREIIFHTRRPTGVKREIATDGSSRITMVDGRTGPNVGLSSSGNHKKIKRLSRSGQMRSRGRRSDQAGSGSRKGDGISADRSCDCQQRSRRVEGVFTRTRRIAIVAAIVAAGLIGFFAAGRSSNPYRGVGQLAARQPHKLEVGSSSLPPAITSNPAKGRDWASQVQVTSNLGGPLIRLMEVTAYCPCEICCGKYADGITASGKPITAAGGKFCAADKSIAFGTQIKIPGYGLAEVLDRGSAITAGKLDLFFPRHDLALAWGRKHLEVVIQ